MKRAAVLCREVTGDPAAAARVHRMAIPGLVLGASLAGASWRSSGIDGLDVARRTLEPKA